MDERRNGQRKRKRTALIAVRLDILPVSVRILQSSEEEKKARSGGKKLRYQAKFAQEDEEASF